MDIFLLMSQQTELVKFYIFLGKVQWKNQFLLSIF